MIVNGDDFRFLHPDLNHTYRSYRDDFAAHTTRFSGETVEHMTERTIVSKLNTAVEGTFRSAATPLRTLKKLKDADYRMEAVMKITLAALSWESINEQYNKDKEAGNIAQKVGGNRHNIVTSLPTGNTRKVFASNLANKSVVYSREKMILSLRAATNDDIATLMQNEISGNIQQ